MVGSREVQEFRSQRQGRNRLAFGRRDLQAFSKVESSRLLQWNKLYDFRK